MTEQFSDNRRLLLPLEDQVAFFKAVQEKTRHTLAKLAQIAGVHRRRMSDWKQGDGSVPYQVAMTLSTLSGIPLPTSGKIVDQYWNNSAAAAKAGKITYEKYGNIGGDQQYRRKQWQKWWRENGKINNLGSKATQKEIGRPEFSVDLAELIGIILGDGGITHRQVKITLDSDTDKAYVPHVAVLFEKLFGAIPAVHKSTQSRAVTLTVSRTALVTFLCEIGLHIGNKVKNQVDIPKWIKNDRTYSVACVQGLMDTDGCVFLEKHLVRGKTYRYPRISFVNHSKPLLASVQKILTDNGFEARLRSNRAVTLEKPADVIRYFKRVGSNNPKHLARFEKYRGACVSGRNRQS